MARKQLGVPRCEDITPEQVLARHRGDAVAWLIDQWERAHPVSSGTAMGRDLDECDVGVLHPSVSAVHARLRQDAEGTWEISDQGSLNGTLVNERTVQRKVLRSGDVVRVGDVSFRFSQHASDSAQPPRGPGQTKRSSLQELPVSTVLQDGERALTLVRSADGGTVKSGDQRIRLAPLEYALLCELAKQRLMAGEHGEAFVPSRELASKLEFRSRLADTDNVRELVRRVRQKLAGLGARDVIETERGSGYRLGWTQVIPADSGW